MNTMTRAHQIRKEAAEKWNCKTSEIIFSICLQMAWTETKEVGVNVEEKAMERINLMAHTAVLYEARDNNELSEELFNLVDYTSDYKIDEMVKTGEIKNFKGYNELVEKYSWLIRKEIRRHTEMAKLVGFEMFAK